MQSAMSKLLGIGAILLLVLGFWGGARVAGGEDKPVLNQPKVDSRTIPVDGFRRVKPGTPLVFPQDHGAHPEYQTEWWYFTGNLWSEDGREFGYQLTFFRRALSPQLINTNRGSEWLTNQVYMAHFAVADVKNSYFKATERLERGAVGLAGAETNPFFSVWLRNWRVDQVDEKTFQLSAHEGSIGLRLNLSDQKGIVLQGVNGYSQKGSEEGNASMYYSFTRLSSVGEIHSGETVYRVSGYSWMDHEFSTSALARDQVGWDWFALQFDDGSELMIYTIRNEKGEIDPFSKGVFIDKDQSITHLESTQFQIQVKSRWRSEKSGGVYPAEWLILIPDLNLELTVKPKIPNQELLVSVIYWEGAVSVSGVRSTRPILGWGYAELTGYVTSMQGRF